MCNNLNKIKVICFDYYGTLVDMDKPFEKIKKWFELKYIGIEIGSNKLFSTFMKKVAVLSTQSFQNGNVILLSSYIHICDRYEIDCYKQEFIEYIEFLFMDVNAYNDAHFVINELKKRYRVGLITNADNYILYESIRKQNFSFDFMVSSEDAQCNKPGVEIYDFARKKLKVSYNEMLMIGDSQIDDIYGASKQGIPVIWINREKRTMEDCSPSVYFEVQELNGILNIMMNW